MDFINHKNLEFSKDQGNRWNGYAASTNQPRRDWQAGPMRRGLLTSNRYCTVYSVTEQAMGWGDERIVREKERWKGVSTMTAWVETGPRDQ